MVNEGFINMKNFILGTTLFLFAVFIIGCGFPFEFSEESSPPPTDQKMQENFHSHEADFKKLMAMLSEDSNAQWVDLESAYSFDAPSQKIALPSGRLREYQRLLRAANVKSVSRDKTSFSFRAWSSGFLADKGKYYFYSETPPSPLADSLDSTDKLPLSADSDVVGYKKIGENWYLNYWED